MTATTPESHAAPRAMLDRVIAVALLTAAGAVALIAPPAAFVLGFLCDAGCTSSADTGLQIASHGPIAALLIASPLIVLRAIRGRRLWLAAAVSLALVCGTAAAGIGLIVLAAAGSASNASTG